MSSAVLVPVMLVIALAALAQIWTDPRITREFRRKSYLALLAYGLFVSVGLLALFALAPDPGNGYAAFAGAGLMLSWIAFGALWLTRLAPRLRAPPGFLLQAWGVVDWSLIALALGLAVFLALS